MNYLGQLFDNLFMSLEKSIGFEWTVRLQDFIQILAGILLGIFLTEVKCALKVRNVAINPDLKEVLIIKTDHHYEAKMATNIHEAFDILLGIMLIKIKKGEKIRLYEVKRAKRIMWVIFTLIIIFAVIALAMAWNVVPDNHVS